MRNLLLLLTATLLFCSCKITMGTKPGKHPKPYAITKSGRTVQLDSPQKKRGPLVANGIKYDKDTLNEYSDGKHEYLRLNKNTFAVKRFEGDIRIYTSSSSYTSYDYQPAMAPGMSGGFKSGSHSHTSYYMLTNRSAALQMMDYKNVEAALSKTEPAYHYIDAYHRQRIAGRITMWAGLGVLIGGFVLSSKSTSDSGDLLAGSTIFTGLMAIPTGLLIRGSAANKLLKAVARHNGVK